MNFVLTEHARDALAKRGIPLSWVERVVRAPEVREADRIDPDLEHRLARIQEHDGPLLRVILNTRTNPPRVVTVFFDRRKASS